LRYAVIINMLMPVNCVVQKVSTPVQGYKIVAETTGDDIGYCTAYIVYRKRKHEDEDETIFEGGGNWSDAVLFPFCCIEIREVLSDK